MSMTQSAAPSLSACRTMLAKDGVCVLPRVLDAEKTAALRRSLTETAELYRQKGGETFLPYLDPNDCNIRVFNLIGLHHDFRELILHPTAVSLVKGLLGDGFMISNFTANIALPGSASMALHADQALVAPAPWLEPWAINIIWCLDDANEANGATRYRTKSGLCCLAITRRTSFARRSTGMCCWHRRRLHRCLLTCSTNWVWAPAPIAVRAGRC